MPTQTLRDVIPYEATFYDQWTKKKLDTRVVETHKPYQNGRRWPGSHKNVVEWWVLADGTIVGFNENMSVGWSFPVMRAPWMRLPKKAAP